VLVGFFRSLVLFRFVVLGFFIVQQQQQQFVPPVSRRFAFVYGGLAVQQSTSTSGVVHIRVTRLTRNVARAHLEEIFGMYGALRRIDIPADRQHPELTRGFAIIEFESPGEAADACRHMDGGQIDGQEIQARLVNPEPPRHNNAGGGRRPAPAGRAGRRRRSSS
uniref:RRM domain-containing protein n=1 Tax=Macrostomum lignano TaxID=282301 RepID=A0A1I8IVY5_9PLAT